MIARLNNSNVLSVVKNGTFNANNSVRSNLIFYIDDTVKEINVADCDVSFVFMDKNKCIYSTILESVNSDIDGYLKYMIRDDNDFALREDMYTGYILIYNPVTKTHVTSTTIRFLAVSSADKDFEIALASNVIDEMYMEFNNMRIDMTEKLNKVIELTKLNIEINKKIEEKGV